MLVKSAVVNQVNGPYEFEELELQDIREDEVVVKLVASGICHSDEAVRIGDADFNLPAVLGHEGAGIIERVGANVPGFEVGDHVLMTYNVCGECPHCRTGHPSSCVDWTPLNMSGARLDGTQMFKKKDGTGVSNFFTQSSFSTYTISNYKNLVKVDKDIDLRVIAPLGCGFLTGAGTVINGLKPKVGDSIVVFGTGAVGLGALMMAKANGCTTIIAVDIHDSRLEVAKDLGATHTINSMNEDAVEKVKKYTNGLGANFAIDTTGVSVVMKQALDALAIQGIVAPVAVSPRSIEVTPFLDLVLMNKTLKGVLMGDAVPQLQLPILIDLYKQGLFPFDKLTKYYDFEQINEASADSASGVTIKPVLIIDKEYKKETPLV